MDILMPEGEGNGSNQTKILRKKENSTNWFFIIILMLIAGYYFNYFFIHKAQRERELSRGATKELVSIIETIKSREAFHVNMLNSWTTDSLCEYFSVFLNGQIECSDKLFTWSYEVLEEGIAEESIYFKDGDMYFRFEKEDSISEEEIDKKIYKDFSLFFEFEEVDMDIIRLLYKVEIDSIRNSYISDKKGFYIPTDSFFKNLLRQRSNFDGYSVTKFKKNRFKEQKDWFLPVYNSTDFYPLDSKTSFELDSLGAFVLMKDVKIGGVDFKVFSATFKIQNTEFGIFTYRDTSKWASEVSEFNFIGTVRFGAVVLLIILAIPHLRIWSLSSGDRLTSIHLMRLMFTLFLVCPVILIYSFVETKNTRIASEIDTRLKEIDSNFKSGFEGMVIELDSTRRGLKKYNSKEDVSTYLTKFSKESDIDEHFYLDDIGKMIKLLRFGGHEPTTFEEFLVNHNTLSYRDYFQKTQTSDDSLTKIQLVKSITSADAPYEVVLAAKNKSLKNNSSISVTTYGPKDTLEILNENSPYFTQIVDSQGDIIFDSRQSTIGTSNGNLFERLGMNTSFDRDDLKKVHTDHVFEGFYENSTSLFIVSPLLSDSLSNKLSIEPVDKYYVVSVADKSKFDDFNAAFIVTSSSLLLGYFILLLMIYVALRRVFLLRRNKFDTTIKIWFFPNDGNALRYTLAFFIVALLVYLKYELFQNVLFLFSIWHFVYILISLLIVFFIINSQGTKNEKKDEGLKKRLKSIGFFRRRRRYSLYSYWLFVTSLFILLCVSPVWNTLKTVESNEEMLGRCYMSNFLNDSITRKNTAKLVEDVKYLDKYVKYRDRFVSFSFIRHNQATSKFQLEENFCPAIESNDELVNNNGEPSQQELSEGGDNTFWQWFITFTKSKLKSSFPFFHEARELAICLIVIFFMIYQDYIFKKVRFRSSAHFDFEEATVVANNKLKFKSGLSKKENKFFKSVNREIKPLPPLNGEFKNRLREWICSNNRRYDNEDLEYFYTIIGKELQEYFRTKWNGCDPKEKLLLYDLAEDGCMNTSNRDVFIRVLEKGLVVYESGSISGPKLFSNSFNDFVLNQLSMDDQLYQQYELSKKGKWSSQKTFVLGIVLILFFASFVFHEGLFEKVSAILTGAIAVIPGLIGSISSIRLPKIGNG